MECTLVHSTFERIISVIFSAYSEGPLTTKQYSFQEKSKKYDHNSDELLVLKCQKHFFTLEEDRYIRRGSEEPKG